MKPKPLQFGLGSLFVLTAVVAAWAWLPFMLRMAVAATALSALGLLGVLIEMNNRHLRRLVNRFNLTEVLPLFPEEGPDQTAPPAHEGRSRSFSDS